MSAALVRAIAVSPLSAQLATQAVAGLDSPHSRRVYGAALRRFLSWTEKVIAESAIDQGLTRQLVQKYMAEIRASGSISSANQALSAIKRLAAEAEIAGGITERELAGIRKIGLVRESGVRQGNWMGLETAQLFLGLPNRQVIEGKIEAQVGARDTALLAVLIGCGLRRSEAAQMRWENVRKIQAGKSGERTILEIPHGKGGKFRTIPVPGWVVERLESWREVLYDPRYTRCYGLEGPRPRLEDVWVRVEAGNDSRGGLKNDSASTIKPNPKQFGGRLTADGIWAIVKRYGALLGMPELAPHDLRRTGAKLMREGGAEIEQIGIVLGHARIETTVKYLGGGVELGVGRAATDRMGLR